MGIMERIPAPIAAIGMALSALVGIAGLVLMGMDVLFLGLPGWSWATIGLCVFFLSVAHLLKAYGIEPLESPPKSMGDTTPAEPKRQHQHSLSEKIDRWRRAVIDHDWDEGHIYKEPVWSEMRAYLPDDFVEEMESGIGVEPVITFGRKSPSDKQRILDGLAELERRWEESGGSNYGVDSPPPPDGALQERRERKIERLREAVERWRRGDHAEDNGTFWDTAECTELMELMTEEEERRFRDAGPRERMQVAQGVLARLEREWGLV
jgi:hypothetical protein